MYRRLACGRRDAACSAAGTAALRHTYNVDGIFSAVTLWNAGVLAG